MTRLKRIGSCAAALALAAAIGVQPAAAAATPYRLSVPSDYQSPFADLQTDDWYYKYVAVLNSLGMIDGYGNGLFGANDPLTSGAALVMVLKAAGSGDLELTGDHWASGYADYALEHGYLTEEEIGDLDAPMARILVAKLAARALEIEPLEGESPFADVEDEYLNALYDMGIITGSEVDGETVFLPDQPITRAEISVIVWQVERVHTYGRQILFQNAYYDILEDVPVNTYDPDGFSKDRDGFMTYEEDGVITALGVDVSVHQGEIDWQRVADSGVEFAMIRIGYRGYGSEGKMMGDVRFKENIDGALSAGLNVGVYYFSQAVTVEEARQEADYVIEQLEPYPITYPVVFDWERQNYAGSRTQTVPETKLLCRMANAFCEEIEDAGYDAMIYFYQNLAYNNLDLSQLTDYPFWLAQYTDYPSFYYDFDMWQYTSSGRVPGIAGDVDLNLRFFRDGERPPEVPEWEGLPEEPEPSEEEDEEPAGEQQPSQDIPPAEDGDSGKTEDEDEETAPEESEESEESGESEADSEDSGVSQDIQ